MRILIFGDSITQGFNDTDYGGWANRLSTYSIEKNTESNYKYDRIIFNLGISGDNTDGLLSRLDGEVKARIGNKKQEIVVLFAIGANDSQYDMETNENRVPIAVYKKNLHEMINKTRAYTNNMVFIGISPVDETKLMPIPWHATHGYNNANVSKYNDARKKVCTKEKLPYISMDNIFEGKKLSEILPDGIHPNAEGHRLMFEHIKKELEKLNIL